MIDEYIVDYEDYVGLGSGAFSFLDGALYVNTFSLQAHAERIEAGKTPALQKRVFNRHDRMRYRFLMSLFGMSLDKRAVRQGLRRDHRHGPAGRDGVHALRRRLRRSTTPTTLVPSAKGRYLLVSMMREFFVGVNNLRDQARAALSTDERELLFGDGTTLPLAPCDEHPLAAVRADTETAQELPVP